MILLNKIRNGIIISLYFFFQTKQRNHDFVILFLHPYHSRISIPLFKFFLITTESYVLWHFPYHNEISILLLFLLAPPYHNRISIPLYYFKKKIE